MFFWLQIQIVLNFLTHFNFKISHVICVLNYARTDGSKKLTAKQYNNAGRHLHRKDSLLGRAGAAFTSPSTNETKRRVEKVAVFSFLSSRNV